ncbi:DUF1441 family protein, partial [Escherichia coli]
NDFMDSVHHIWCPLFSQEFQDLPDGAETTLTFMGLPPPVAESEMDPHERKAWYQSERERLKFEQETAQLIPASDVRREFAIWAKAVVQVLETLPDILERDCGLQPAAVSRVQSIIDDLRDQIALRVTEAGADDEEELQQEE